MQKERERCYAWVPPTPHPYFHQNECDAVVNESFIPVLGLIYLVPLLLLSIGYLDVSFSYIMAKSATNE